jgi:hypothetical protein
MATATARLSSTTGDRGKYNGTFYIGTPGTLGLIWIEWYMNSSHAPIEQLILNQ